MHDAPRDELRAPESAEDGLRHRVVMAMTYLNERSLWVVARVAERLAKLPPTGRPACTICPKGGTERA